MSPSFILLVLCAVYATAQFQLPFPFPSLFPIFCGTNEVRGDACVTPDRQCGDADEPRPGNTTFCRRCICRPNHVRDSRRRCISQEDCDRCNAAAHEEYRNCGRSCPLICGEAIPTNCSRECVQGCFCMPGHIRSSRNGPCVPNSQCSPRCPPNSSFTRCWSLFSRVCNATVATRGFDFCMGVGCACNQGFLLSPDRQSCVPLEECLQDGLQ
uniref:Hypothetical conserved secreted protein n=1 Tax=Ornithodoros coriaceus TaxID=92741 RepID=B2D2F4_ORNCO|nr:hypothetical conserved secreted protein [Ornithodoros coriaceus]